MNPAMRTQDEFGMVDSKLGDRTTSRRKFLGYAAGAIGIALSLSLAGGLLRRRSTSHGGRWYEVVQDMKDPYSWHINLYSGPVLGDLSQGQLLEHRLARNTSLSEIRRRLDYPARIQHLGGQQEQTF